MKRRQESSCGGRGIRILRFDEGTPSRTHTMGMVRRFVTVDSDIRQQWSSNASLVKAHILKREMKQDDSGEGPYLTGTPCRPFYFYEAHESTLL